MQIRDLLTTIVLTCFLFAGCNSPTTTDPAILKTLCKNVAAEDADNNGITAAGTPWNLSDLTTDTVIQYMLAKNEKLTDLRPTGEVLRETLRAQPGDESIEHLCQSIGIPISTSNPSKGKSVTEAISALDHSVKKPGEE